MKQKYYYTSDSNDTYHVHLPTHLAQAAGLRAIPDGATVTAHCDGALNNPRCVWAKEARPPSPTSTNRIKLIVQADSPIYRTSNRHDVVINGVHYVTTGRVGETMTFETDSSELVRELSKPHTAQSAYPARTIKDYLYIGDDGTEYYYSGAEYLAVAAALQEIRRRPGLPHADKPSKTPRYVWVKEAVPYSHGKTRRLRLVVQADSPLYRTNDRHPVFIDGSLYITTGRVGECYTFIQ